MKHKKKKKKLFKNSNDKDSSVPQKQNRVPYPDHGVQKGLQR